MMLLMVPGRGSLTTGDYMACGNTTLKLTERYLCMSACVKIHYTHELTAAAAASIRSAQEQDKIVNIPG